MFAGATSKTVLLAKLSPPSTIHVRVAAERITTMIPPVSSSTGGIPCECGDSLCPCCGKKVCFGGCCEFCDGVSQFDDEE